MYTIPGIILVVVGIVINVTINRNRFYRRNPSGLQQFKNYGSAVLTTYGERLGKLLAWVLIIVGILCFVIHPLTQKATEKGTKAVVHHKEHAS